MPCLSESMSSSNDLAIAPRPLREIVNPVVLGQLRRSTDILNSMAQVEESRLETVRSQIASFLQLKTLAHSARALDNIPRSVMANVAGFAGKGPEPDGEASASHAAADSSDELPSFQEMLNLNAEAARRFEHVRDRRSHLQGLAAMELVCDF